MSSLYSQNCRGSRNPSGLSTSRKTKRSPLIAYGAHGELPILGASAPCFDLLPLTSGTQYSVKHRSPNTTAHASSKTSLLLTSPPHSPNRDTNSRVTPPPTLSMVLSPLTRLFSLSLSLSNPSRLVRSSLMSLTSANTRAKATLRGVVFDMDGTLTVPVIDFQAMYREVLGVERYTAAKKAGGGAIDILHQIETWGADEQKRAYDVIARFEQEGLDRLQIMPGALELCGFLDSREIRRGLITRNVNAAVDVFHQRFGLRFIPALSREFRPYKPDPAPLLHICNTWNIPPNKVMMIGDSLKDDIVCGKRAGAFTCLLDETGRYGPHESLKDDVRPDFKVSSLVEIFTILESHFDLPVPKEAQAI